MNNLGFEKRIKWLTEKTNRKEFPLVIELAGITRAGKTEFTDALFDLFRKSGVKTTAYVQGEYSCPITDRWSVDFSVWGITNFIRQFYEFKYSGEEFIIADRGLFDTMLWLRLKLERGISDEETYNLLRNLAMDSLWWKHQAVVIAFNADVEIVLDRARERRLYGTDSLVTNEEVLPKLQKTLVEEVEKMNQVLRNRGQLPIVKYLYTGSKGLRDVLVEAAETVVATLEERIVEK
jgi:hypothetical protein